MSFKDILMSNLRELKDGKVGLLLSGGSGSAAVLFALLELGKEVHAYTFHMEGVESTDLIKARDLANKLGIEFTQVPLPNDIDTIKSDCLFLINNIGCRLKTDIECAFPIKYVLPLVKEEVITSGLGDDIYFGLSKKAQIHFKSSVDLMGEYNKKMYDANAVQIQFFKDMGSSYGVEVHSPYQSKSMLNHFDGKSWDVMNKPKIKQPILDAFPEEFSKLETYHANFQKGDSEIAENFAKLVDSDWNIHNYKSVVGVYNTVARREITKV